MKLALVTTSPAIRSAVGDYARALLPHLREACDLRVFVEPGVEPGELDGAPLAPITELDPRACDRLVFQLGDEACQAFMPRVVRALGGTVMLHAWSLFDLAVAAYPALASGGLRGFALALREGGPLEARELLRRPLADGRRGGVGLELCLNRSIVRHADSFLVHERSVGERIRDDRNAPTAIGLLPRPDEASWSEIARVSLTRLEHFPPPRSTRGARVAFGAWKRAQSAAAGRPLDGGLPRSGGSD